MMSKLQPIDPTVAAEMGHAARMAQRGDLLGARRHVETTIANGADDAPVHAFAGMLCCQAGDLAAGIVHLRVAHGADPDDMTTVANLAMALVASGQLETADELCSEERANSDPSFRIWRLRGYCAQHRDDYAGARHAYERVVAALPNDFETWNNLGNARLALGETVSAIVALETAARLRPDLIAIRLNLALALADGGQLEDAVLALDACARDFPTDPRPFSQMGSVLSNLHRDEEALAPIRIAADLAPDDADLKVRLGERLALLWSTDEAEAAYRRALSLVPDHASAFLQLALLFDQTNRVDAFADLIAEAEAKGVAEGTLHFIRAVAYRRAGRFDDGLAEIEAAPAEIEPRRRAQLAGEFQDRLGRADEAFEAFSEMNRLARMDPTDPVQRSLNFHENLAAERDLVSPSWFAGWTTDTPQPERPSPIFLVGFPRSGTTLLDTILMGHPAVRVLEERPPLRVVEQSLNGLRSLATMSADEIARARTLYFDEVAKFTDVSDGNILIDKFPMHLNKVPLIHRLFPGARFVLALRHPCDVVLSCFFTSFRLNNAMVNFCDLETAARTYDQTFGYWEQCRATFPIEVSSLSYESIIAGGSEVLEPLFAELGLSWRERTVDHTETAVARGGIPTASYAQVTEPLYRRSANRWQRYRRHMEPVLPILRPWVEKFGYEL